MLVVVWSSFDYLLVYISAIEVVSVVKECPSVFIERYRAAHIATQKSLESGKEPTSILFSNLIEYGGPPWQDIKP